MLPNWRNRSCPGHATPNEALARAGGFRGGSETTYRPAFCLLRVLCSPSQVGNDDPRVAVKRLDVFLPHLSNLVDDRGIFHGTGSVSSSGVQSTGDAGSASSHTDLIGSRNLALARWFRFQASRYRTPWVAQIARFSASRSAFAAMPTPARAARPSQRQHRSTAVRAAPPTHPSVVTPHRDRPPMPR